MSLRSLQAYDDYGASDDPQQLQTQVRELKAQLENQTRLILHMQSFLRRSSLSSELAATVMSDPSASRDLEEHGHRDRKEAESQAVRDKSGRLSLELDRERSLNRSVSEPPQQSRSRSTSPARSAAASLNTVKRAQSSLSSPH